MRSGNSGIRICSLRLGKLFKIHNRRIFITGENHTRFNIPYNSSHAGDYSGVCSGNGDSHNQCGTVGEFTCRTVSDYPSYGTVVCGSVIIDSRKSCKTLVDSPPVLAANQPRITVRKNLYRIRVADRYTDDAIYDCRSAIVTAAIPPTLDILRLVLTSAPITSTFSINPGIGACCHADVHPRPAVTHGSRDRHIGKLHIFNGAFVDCRPTVILLFVERRGRNLKRQTRKRISAAVKHAVKFGYGNGKAIPES